MDLTISISIWGLETNLDIKQYTRHLVFLDVVCRIDNSLTLKATVILGEKCAARKAGMFGRN